MSSCRSCEAPIFWTLDATTGRAQPLDLEPRPVPVSRVVPAQESLFGDEVPTHYVSHFVTCPDAQEWKGKGR